MLPFLTLVLPAMFYADLVRNTSRTCPMAVSGERKKAHFHGAPGHMGLGLWDAFSFLEGQCLVHGVTGGQRSDVINQTIHDRAEEREDHMAGVSSSRDFDCRHVLSEAHDCSCSTGAQLSHSCNKYLLTTYYRPGPVPANLRSDFNR